MRRSNDSRFNMDSCKIKSGEGDDKTRCRKALEIRDRLGSVSLILKSTVTLNMQTARTVCLGVGLYLQKPTGLPRLCVAETKRKKMQGKAICDLATRIYTPAIQRA